MPRRPVPARAVRGARATRSRTCGHSQWNGVAVVSRVGLEDVAGRLPRAAGLGRAGRREARAIGATCDGVRVWSLYVPNGRDAGRPAPGLQAGLAGAPARAPVRGWLADDPEAQIALVGDWNVAPPDEDVWDMAVLRGQHPRLAAGARGLPGRRGRRLRRRRPAATPRASSPTGTTRSCASRARRACGSTSRWPPRRWPTRVTGAEIVREERKGKGASDHAPVVFHVADAEPVGTTGSEA